MSIEAQLREAIAGRRAVSVRYQGGQPARVLHPHALFFNRRKQLSLDAFQVGGYTTSGELPAWRQFLLTDMLTVELLDQAFSAAPGWNPAAEKYRHGLAAWI